jgi:hypothetical protein
VSESLYRPTTPEIAAPRKQLAPGTTTRSKHLAATSHGGS